MNTPTKPAIHTPQDLLFYTGVPNIPPEKADKLTQEKRAKGGKTARKTISGVKKHTYPDTGSGRSGTKCWRAYVAASGMNARAIHPAFTYDCPTKEEAAYIASMAHRRLKPWFAQWCRDGDENNEPAGPGHPLFFLNNIWALWKLCRLGGPNGDYIVGALCGDRSARPVFVTDFSTEIYRELVAAPIFNRRTVNKRKNHEPVQPYVYRDEDGKAKVEWIGLSELVLGEKMDIPPSRLIGIDFRKAALLGQDPPPIFPGFGIDPKGWTPMTEPERFNAVIALNRDMAVHHPYGVAGYVPR